MSVAIEATGERRVTLRTLAKMKERGEVFACLAAYDATMARWLDRAGVHVLLAGDSGAQLALGLERTIEMPLEVAVAMTAALRRGASRALVMADMPFLSFQADDAEAIHNAGRFMTEGLADVVKLEADASFAGLVQKMTRAGIPVCAHVGLRPQAVSLEGGYRAQGRTADEAERVIGDAVALADAGAVLILIEAVPEEVATAVVERVRVPVIGIGAGRACDGQILVAHDLLGLSDATPRFAERAAELGEEIRRAASGWVEAVRDRRPGGEGYVMRQGEQDKLAARLGWSPADGGRSAGFGGKGPGQSSDGR